MAAYILQKRIPGKELKIALLNPPLGGSSAGPLGALLKPSSGAPLAVRWALARAPNSSPEDLLVSSSGGSHHAPPPRLVLLHPPLDMRLTGDDWG